MRVRTKCIEYDALLFTGHNHLEMCNFSGQYLRSTEYNTLEVITSDGTVELDADEYLLRDADGTLSVFQQKNFETDFDIIEE